MGISSAILLQGRWSEAVLIDMRMIVVMKTKIKIANE